MKMWKTYKDNDADNYRQQTNDQKCSHEPLAGSGELKCIVHVFDLDNTLQFQASHCYIFAVAEEMKYLYANQIIWCKTCPFLSYFVFIYFLLIWIVI